MSPYPPQLGASFYEQIYEHAGLLMGIVEDLGNDMKHIYVNEMCKVFLQVIFFLNFY